MGIFNRRPRHPQQGYRPIYREPRPRPKQLHFWRTGPYQYEFIPNPGSDPRLHDRTPQLAGSETQPTFFYARTAQGYPAYATCPELLESLVTTRTGPDPNVAYCDGAVA
jgi:hypothetical protein